MGDSDRSRVAIIDIGSNSIKLLVAERDKSGRFMVIDEATDETRIGTGIADEQPRLREAGMEAGTASVAHLQAIAVRNGASRISVTATSAVRDAVNREEFAARIEQKTGLDLRVLSGREEAEAIARGVRLDPDLETLADFYLFDLGGGSLEVLSIGGTGVRSLDSLPLGCVRLTEKFISDREAPFSGRERERIDTHVREVLENSDFRFDLPAGASAVATGGTAAVARYLVGHGPGPPGSNGLLTRESLESLLGRIAPLTLRERREFPGMPTGRADVYPVALATLLTVLEIGGITSLRHSFCNLRFGEAARLLE